MFNYKLSTAIEFGYYGFEASRELSDEYNRLLIKNLYLVNKRLTEYQFRKVRKEGLRCPMLTTIHFFYYDRRRKAREIAYDDSLYGDSDNNSKTEECYTAAMAMAEYKDAEYDEYIQNVLVFKMLYFLDQEEQRRGLSLDQIEDWRGLRDGFMKYLESQKTE